MTEAWITRLQDLLGMLKIDLGIMTLAYDKRLKQYIESAFESISLEGITLNEESMIDKQLVVSYAGWLWSKRDTGAAMPRMLRYALNNRLFSEKMRIKPEETEEAEDEETEETEEAEDEETEEKNDNPDEGEGALNG